MTLEELKQAALDLAEAEGVTASVVHHTGDDTWTVEANYSGGRGHHVHYQTVEWYEPEGKQIGLRKVDIDLNGRSV